MSKGETPSLETIREMLVSTSNAVGARGVIATSILIPEFMVQGSDLRKRAIEALDQHFGKPSKAAQSVQ